MFSLYKVGDLRAREKSNQKFRANITETTVHLLQCRGTLQIFLATLNNSRTQIFLKNHNYMANHFTSGLKLFSDTKYKEAKKSYDSAVEWQFLNDLFRTLPKEKIPWGPSMTSQVLCSIQIIVVVFVISQLDHNTSEIDHNNLFQ